MWGASYSAYVIRFAIGCKTPDRSLPSRPIRWLAGIRCAEHMEYNHLNSVAECINVAIGDQEGPATLFIDGLNGLARLDTPYECLAAGKPITVTMTAVDILWTDWSGS